jgi:hypothetical protein
MNCSVLCGAYPAMQSNCCYAAIVLQQRSLQCEHRAGGHSTYGLDRSIPLRIPGNGRTLTCSHRSTTDLSATTLVQARGCLCPASPFALNLFSWCLNKSGVLTTRLAAGTSTMFRHQLHADAGVLLAGHATCGDYFPDRNKTRVQ